MSRKVIIVDGPVRGRIVDCDGPVYCVAKAAGLFPWSLAEAEQPLPSFEQITYHIHRVLLFGRMVYVGSTRVNQPHEADLFEALASNDAKDLVRS